MRSMNMRRRVARAELGVFLALVVSLGGCGLFAQQPPAKNSSPPAHPASQEGSQAGNIVDTPGTAVLIRGAHLTLTPSTQLTFSGNGFAPSEALAISIADAQGTTQMALAPVKADRSGDVVSASVAVPADLTPGTHLLVVQGETSQHIAHAAFQVQRIPPTVQLDSYSAEPGYVFGVSGNGFAANEKVEVYLGSTKSTPVATLNSGAGGNVAGRITVPTRPPGEYKLYLVGQTSATPVAVAFNIQGFKPWVTLEDYAPATGATVRASGQDFAPNERVLVYLNAASGQPIAPLQANGRGAFTNARVLVVSDGLTGQQTLIFVGERSRASTQTAFEVLPSSETPSPGTP